MSVITCLSWVPRGYAKSQPIQQDMDLDHLEDLKDQQLATDDELDMANYDAEDAVPEFTNVDPDPDLENLEDEEAEDNKINPEDALILAGVQNGDFSEIHVYIYVEKTSALYVHHDIMLNAYPLSLSWLPYNPKNPGEAGNCVAVSTFQKGIEIWDLDQMDPLEPVVTLGGYKFKDDEALGLNSGKKRKQKKTLKKGSHKDSVLSTALHPSRK